MRCYIALLTKDRPDRYCIALPDFPGCLTWSSTLAEARIVAERMLAEEIELRTVAGQPVPRPTAAEWLLDRAARMKAIPIVVTAPEPVADRVSVHVDLPAGLVARVDERAREHGVDRSGLIEKLRASRFGKPDARIVATEQGTERVIGKGSAFAVLVCAIGMAALPVQAWEYGRWGMTPAELIAASGGAAKLMAVPEPRSDGKLVAKAEAEARLETVAVGAEFRFDPASDRLVEIALRAEGKERCVALIGRMRERYGLPLSSARLGQIESFRWHDSARSARVILLSIELTSDVRCSATYADAARGG